MIIVKTPLRISFVGGGSDIPSFYTKTAGATLSTAINKYIYISVNTNFHENVRVSYSKTEIVDHVHLLEHSRVRECMKLAGIHNGVEIVTMADVPSKGTGLGSSSSLVVGVLKALCAYKGQTVSEQQLAEDACKVEIEILGEPIGKQDQYIASFGGMRFMRYLPNHQVAVDSVAASPEILRQLEESILLIYTGMTRDAGKILRQQVEGYEQAGKFQTMEKMVDLAHELKKQFEQNDISHFGEVLHESWELKKQLSPEISNSEVDALYGAARQAGALGGKLLGAGGGGFLMVYAPKDRHETIRQAIVNYKIMDIKFDPEGSRTLFFNKNL